MVEESTDHFRYKLRWAKVKAAFMFFWLKAKLNRLPRTKRFLFLMLRFPYMVKRWKQRSWTRPRQPIFAWKSCNRQAIEQVKKGIPSNCRPLSEPTASRLRQAGGLDGQRLIVWSDERPRDRSGGTFKAGWYYGRVKRSCPRSSARDWNYAGGPKVTHVVEFYNDPVSREAAAGCDGAGSRSAGTTDVENKNAKSEEFICLKPELYATRALARPGVWLLVEREWVMASVQGRAEREGYRVMPYPAPTTPKAETPEAKTTSLNLGAAVFIYWPGHGWCIGKVHGECTNRSSRDRNRRPSAASTHIVVFEERNELRTSCVCLDYEYYASSVGRIPGAWVLLKPIASVAIGIMAGSARSTSLRFTEISKGQYELRAPHPLHKTHLLVPRKRFATLVLSGDPPPKDPRDARFAANGYTRMERSFARYALANFCPWSAWSPLPLKYERWLSWVELLERQACLRTPRESDLPEDGQKRLQRLLAACRLQEIATYTRGLTTNYDIAKLLSAHRERARRLWTAGKGDAPSLFEDENGEIGNADKEAAKTLDKLRKASERLRGNKDLTKRLRLAVAAREWAEELRNVLPSRYEATAHRQGSGAIPHIGAALRSVWFCAAQPARRTMHGVERCVADVESKNRTPLAPAETQVALAAIHGTTTLPVPLPGINAQTNVDGNNPFAPIDDDMYEALAARYAAGAADAGGEAPLNPEQREGGRSFLRAAEIRAAGFRRGDPTEVIDEAIRAECSPVTLVVGAGGTGKSAMVHRLSQQMKARKCGHLVITAYTVRCRRTLRTVAV